MNQLSKPSLFSLFIFSGRSPWAMSIISISLVAHQSITIGVCLKCTIRKKQWVQDSKNDGSNPEYLRRQQCFDFISTILQHSLWLVLLSVLLAPLQSNHSSSRAAYLVANYRYSQPKALLTTIDRAILSRNVFVTKVPRAATKSSWLEP